LGVAGLGFGQDLANEVHWVLYFEGVPLFFSLHHQSGADHLRGERNVAQKRFSIDRRNQDRGLRQKLLDRVKRLLGLGSLFEMIGLLQKSIEREASFAEAQDETAERGEAPHNSLYPLYVLNRAYPRDGRDLLWVGFDAMLGDDKTQQHTPWDPENTLLGVELNVVCSKFHEGLLQVGYDLVIPFGFDHDVIHVGLNGPPNETPKTLEHAALVRSRRVF